MDNILKEKIDNMLEGIGTCLYTTEFGSVLYGTNSPESDVDYRGIFLPHQSSMLLGRHQKNIHFTTGCSHSKNTRDDLDIQLWSLQYFLELLGNGDTGALDLLFSMYSTHNKKYAEDFFIKQLNRYTPMELVDVRNTKAYVNYAYHQAKNMVLKAAAWLNSKKSLNILKIMIIQNKTGFMT